MILGAAAVALAVALLLAPLDRSRVARRLARFGVRAVRSPRRARIIAGALGGAAGLLTPLGPLGVPLGAYLGALVPRMLAERRRNARDRAIARGTLATVELVEALVASGRPVEHAFASVARQGVGVAAIGPLLAGVADAYALGAPLFRALAASATASGAEALAALGQDLERSRDVGRASHAALRSARDALRAAERARALAAASAVEPRLTLVLVLCYLPALMLAAVVPLFLWLLETIA